MKILCIHAHFDDFEFACAGLFLLWKQKGIGVGSSISNNVQGKILICTDGAVGHHRLSRAETTLLRQKEQAAAAELGGFEWEMLRAPDGSPFREGCIQTDRLFLAALWKSIREYQPDYIICPPIPRDPRIGIHVDHLQVAEGVRRVAYLINAPHAYTPEFPDIFSDKTTNQDPNFINTPVIMTAFDAYMAKDESHDLEIDITEVMDPLAEMAYCHQSQISEWLPWVGRHSMEAPSSLDDWKRQLQTRFQNRNRSLGLSASALQEVFTITAWGTIPSIDKLKEDLPEFNFRDETELAKRLSAWNGD